MDSGEREISFFPSLSKIADMKCQWRVGKCLPSQSHTLIIVLGCQVLPYHWCARQMTIKDPSNHKGIRILLNFLIEARIELGEFIPSIWQQRFAVFWRVLRFGILGWDDTRAPPQSTQRRQRLAESIFHRKANNNINNAMRDKHVMGQRDASDTYLRVHVAGAIRIPIKLLILQFFTSPPHFMSLYDFIKVH